MKTIAKILPFMIVVLFANSCSMICKKGKGNIRTETRNLTDFDKIQIKGQATVYLVSGLEPKVSVSIDSNLTEFIKTEVSGNKLKIFENRCLKELSEFKILVNINRLTEIEVEGSVNLICDSVLRVDNLDLISESSGEVKLNLDLETLDLQSNGSGFIQLTGRANNFNLKLKSSGSVDANNLIAKNIKFNVTGAGTCEVNVTENLSGEVSSSGKLYYKGNPKKVDTNNTGTGTIRTNQ
ncbi:MAG: head GIN domain-containing protein [Bacteroidales bacterium]